jgi:putative tryptophan/tyrosine transport system substrate-binding protein
VRASAIRRALVCLVLGIFLVPQHPAAQGKVRHLGYLSSGSPPSGGGFNPTEPFRDGLAEAGYAVGQTLVIHERYAAGQDHRLADLAADLVRRKVDLIVTVGDQATAAARKATREIPIVMAVSTDPVGVGLVASLARPGGNVTGLTTISPELGGKRLEVLKQVVPGASRIAVLWNASNPGKATEFRELQTAAQRLAIAVWSIEIRGEADFERAFRTISRDRTDALLTLREPLVQGHQKQIVQLALRNRLPDMHVGSEWADDGGLMAYGPSLNEIFRRSAVYVDKILKGAKPADLPIEQPTRFELVINLRTAKTLGLTVPRSVLLQADRIIE